LGALLEAKGGAPAGAVLAKEVFTPARMKHAGIVVHGRPAEVDFAPMGRVRPENFFTAGNGYASANDLLSFFEALEGEALLDAESKATLFAGSAKHDRAALGCWAYPFADGDGGTTLLVERPGSFGDVKLVTAFYPEKRRAIVFWTGEPLVVGKPRTKDSIASKLARVALE
jgi:CubicO group peptidase (beta-lactamase class C family)